MKEKDFWNTRLTDLFQKNEQTPGKYNWKIMHLIVAKNNMPIIARGHSALEIAMKIIKWEFFRDLPKRERDFVNQITGVIK